MIKILFVCHGNICRSTMAQYVMEDLARRAGLEEEICPDSAGTSTDEIGNPVHPGTRRKLAEMGVRCGDHRARQLTARDYQDFDYLVGMDAANLRDMARMLGGDPQGKMSLLLDNTACPGSIADPWYTGDFDATWRDVLEGCRGLLERLKREGHFRQQDKRGVSGGGAAGGSGTREET